jgi:hypothetical protein
VRWPNRVRLKKHSRGVVEGLVEALVNPGVLGRVKAKSKNYQLV